MTNRETIFDVAIVGFGPVGQVLASLLGQLGYRIAVYEQQPSPYMLPRACVVDDEVMRILQGIGIAEEFAKVCVPGNGQYVWLNSEGRVLLNLKRNPQGLSGWHARYTMYQPDLEALLIAAAHAHPNVAINRGCELIGLEQDADGVDLHLHRSIAGAPPEKFKIRARYVVGADGANSAVRGLSAMQWEDLGFRADWLVVDFRLKNPGARLDMPQVGQLCDPARPVTLVRYLGHNHVRWEFMLLPGETSEQMTEEKVWSLLARWVRPGDGEIIRRAVYTFKSGVAADWRDGRVFIAGDAAHLMPPFLGQGMCSGFRDANALAWRLDMALKTIAAEDVFASYTDERKQHVRGVIDLSVALGKIVCVTDPSAAAARDAAILEGRGTALPPFPSLAMGAIKCAADGTPVAPAGLLSPQGRVRFRGRTALLDDIFGARWMLLSRNAELARVIATDASDAWRTIGGEIVVLGHGEGTDDVAVDIDAAYDAYFDALKVDAVLVRPDFYVFAAIRTPDDFSQAMKELTATLGLRVATAVSHHETGEVGR